MASALENAAPAGEGKEKELARMATPRILIAEDEERLRRLGGTGDDEAAAREIKAVPS